MGKNKTEATENSKQVSRCSLIRLTSTNMNLAKIQNHEIRVKDETLSIGDKQAYILSDSGLFFADGESGTLKKIPIKGQTAYDGIDKIFPQEGILKDATQENLKDITRIIGHHVSRLPEAIMSLEESLNATLNDRLLADGSKKIGGKKTDEAITELLGQLQKVRTEFENGLAPKEKSPEEYLAFRCQIIIEEVEKSTALKVPSSTLDQVRAALASPPALSVVANKEDFKERLKTIKDEADLVLPGPSITP